MKKYKLNICRVGYSHNTIVVEAKTEKDAKKLALDQAGDFLYSEKDADYLILDVSVTKE